MHVDVLGPLRMRTADGRDTTPTGTLQKRLLSALVLSRGHVLTSDAASEAVWPTALPAEPAAALQNHVSRLRRELPEGAIESVADGYRLDPARVDVDADRLLDAIAGAGPELDAILDRWHGPAYPELADYDPARTEAARLDDLRIRAIEARAAGRLAAGHTAGLVAELTALADTHPLRERPRELLMAALVAEARHTEALRVYDDFRRLLGDELGTEPSPALAARHAELLAGTATEPQVAAGAATPSRLPLPSTSLVGRDDLADTLLALAERERMVTLVGPGGVGKTRLLIELGHRLGADRPARPVVMCELATGDDRAAADVVAAALRIDARPGVPLIDRIAEVLDTAEVVLLLDNCEHVLPIAAALAECVLARCPRVHVLATSRERLRVPGEHVVPVPTLPLGRHDAPSVQLFVERARAVSPDFDPGPAELGRIVDIVGRLDGLPLAIELAAARLHTHAVDEVAAGLDDRFALLTAGHRTSARHGSLGAAVAWSFGLLDRQLQTTFAALSAFAAAFTVDDAAAIAAVDTATAAEQLTQLVERSLVLRTPDRRYMLLETLRAFGAEQLRATAGAATVCARHLRHQVDWIEAARARMLEPGSGALTDIDAALPELRSALSWALDHRQIELAGRLVVPLLDYGFLRLRPDVLAWAERVTAADPDDTSPVAANVWVIASYAAWMAGDVPECRARALHALELAERSDAAVPVDVITAVGSYELFLGHLDAARDMYRRAADTPSPHDPARPLMAAASEILARGYAGADADAAELAEQMLAETPADTPYAAYAWYCAGEADVHINPARARQRFARALEIAERTHASFVVGTAGASKASIDARTGDPHAAAADYRYLIHHWRRAGMWSTQWTMLRSIAGLLARLGRFRDAAVLVGAIRATIAGHRVFGADEVALEQLSKTLASELGPEVYAVALREGAVLDGNAAVEHALLAL